MNSKIVLECPYDPIDAIRCGEVVTRDADAVFYYVILDTWVSFFHCSDEEENVVVDSDFFDEFVDFD